MNQKIWSNLRQSYDKKRKELCRKMSKIDVRKGRMWKTRWIIVERNLSKQQGQNEKRKRKGKPRNSRISENKKIQKIKEKS